MQNKFCACIGSALAGIIVFRFANPYAFTKGVSLNPRWIEWLKLQWQLAQPSVNYPPSVQWIDNPWTNCLWDLRFTMGTGVAILCAIIIGFCIWRRFALSLVALALLFLVVGFTAPNHYPRYLLPAYPLLFALVGVASKNRIIKYAAAAVTIQAVIWSVTFTTIYRHDHTRIQAAKWVAEYLPSGRIAYESEWDDRLPIATESNIDLNLFSGRYPATQRADYIFITSRRVLGSAGRVFPETRKYYEQLFSGISGFRLVKTFSAGLNDESADESFQVYDHPDVFLFARTLRKPPNGAAE